MWAVLRQVWTLRKGMWSDEMINYRRESTVSRPPPASPQRRPPWR